MATRAELEAEIAARKAEVAAQPRERAAWLDWDVKYHRVTIADLVWTRRGWVEADMIAEADRVIKTLEARG